jgi:single-strand DNA-binding protein
MHTEATFQIVGRITQDVSAPLNERAPVRLPLAVNRLYGEGEGRREATAFFDAQTWNKGARELAARGAFRKGRYVLLRGQIEDSRWTTDDGDKRRAVELTAFEVAFLDPKPDQPG